MGQGIKVEQAKVFAGRILDIDFALGAYAPAVLPATAKIRAGSATVGQIKLEPREGFEHAAKYEAGRRHCSIGGIPDQIAQMVSLEPILTKHVGGMEERGHVQVLHDCPEGR